MTRVAAACTPPVSLKRSMLRPRIKPIRSKRLLLIVLGKNKIKILNTARNDLDQNAGRGTASTGHATRFTVLIPAVPATMVCGDLLAIHLRRTYAA